jgi:hypothetical protein
MTVLSPAVKYLHSGLPGIAQLSSVAGSFVAVLDSALVTGHGLAAASSIVVTNGVAVATFASHTFTKWASVRVSGCSEPLLDGDHRVINTSINTITFKVSGVANGSYTSAQVKYAPLGFEISHQSGHTRIYRSTDPARNAVSLYVDDSNTVAGWNGSGTNKAMAYMAAVTDVVDIATFTTCGSTWWLKQATNTATAAVPWTIVGDSLGFYGRTLPLGDERLICPCSFMQLNSHAAGDAFCTIFEGYGGASADTLAAASCSKAIMSRGYGQSRHQIARDLSQTGSAKNFSCAGGLFGLYGTTTTPYAYAISGGQATGTNVAVQNVTFPNPANLGVIASSGITVLEGSTLRGELPGTYSTAHVRPYPSGEVVADLPGMGDAALLYLTEGAYTSSIAANAIYVGGFFYNLTESWR